MTDAEKLTVLKALSKTTLVQLELEYPYQAGRLSLPDSVTVVPLHAAVTVCPS